MSLRIQSDPAGGATASEVSRAAQSTSASSEAGKIGSKIGSGGDRVDVSSATEAISAGISAQNLQRANRVAQLGALYARGQYSADSMNVSRAIVSGAVTGSVAGQA